MDSSARGLSRGSWVAAGFWEVWQRLDAQERGYIDEKELDVSFHQMLMKLGLTILALRWMPVPPRRGGGTEKIFAHYDVPSIRGVDLDKFREILLRDCDVNKDEKTQKSELASCLGLKTNP